MKNFHQTLSGVQTFEMIFISGGIFDMGDEHGDLWEACLPVHKVKVSDFYIGKYPVTQALWKAVMNGENPSHFQGDDRPVENVSWEDVVQKFLPALQKLTGLEYRLPSEAEWEYAARSPAEGMKAGGGKFHSEGCKYAGSDRLKDVGWFDENSGRETKPVGLKYPNQLGLYDMSGNVWEWCEDLFGGSDYYETCKKIGLAENPKGPENGSRRVLRGGSWLIEAQICRVAYRGHNSPVTRWNTIGFRLALSLQ